MSKQSRSRTSTAQSTFSTSSAALLVPIGSSPRGGGGERGRQEDRKRSNTFTSSSSSSSRRSSTASSDIEAILRRSPSPSFSSSTSHSVNEITSAQLQIPGTSQRVLTQQTEQRQPLRPALQRRPTSQTYLTTFPFPHPATSPSATSGEGGSWAWLTGTFKIWSVKGNRTSAFYFSECEGEGSAWGGSEVTATATGIGTAGAGTPLLHTPATLNVGAGETRPKRSTNLAGTENDASDPYGYRALAGPQLLPSFHAPRAQHAHAQAAQSARSRFGIALLGALIVAVTLAGLGKLGVGVLGRAGWLARLERCLGAECQAKSVCSTSSGRLHRLEQGHMHDLYSAPPTLPSSSTLVPGWQARPMMYGCADQERQSEDARGAAVDESAALEQR